ncbi:MAG: outer membrane protein assembly factor BamA [Deltaproteobacteria bacterium HGW-Deltaproteobacteria-21]|nr:MAG: outer membrane protein assembly factor BamA [Deltaproteobacteria bacterium HGW-Deltaproteobacteria-21]
MGGFMRRSKGNVIAAALFSLLAFWGGLACPVHAQEKKTIAVLPFKIHSPQPLDPLKLQLQEMLAARMTKEGFEVVSLGTVNAHPMAQLPVTEVRDAATLGRDVNADYVLIGSLTHIGGKISLDVKAVDVTTRKPPFSLFVVEDDIERLPEAVERATNSLSNQIAGFIQIDSVQVRGNRRIESEAILAVVESRKGDRLDQEKLDKDLRSIYAMGFFKDVNMEIEDGPKGKIVIVSVNEKPSIAKIAFEGNKKEKEEDLKKETGIKLYSILNPSEIKQSVNRLREYYRQKGYYNVEIKSEVNETPNNEVALIYRIEENKKLYIRDIEFTGNTHFSDRQLKKQMEISEKGLLSFITKSGVFNKEKLEFDLQKITAFYHNHGYIRAKTGEPEVIVGEDRLTIAIEIIEGDQYAVDNVRVAGDLLRPEEELLKRVKINKEKNFSREIVRKDSLALRDLYADEGYAYAEVVPLVQEDDKKKLVDITYQVTQKKKVMFERINITGNTETRDKVVRRELKVAEGEYFSGQELKKSTQNLHRLGFFEDVEIQTKKGSQDDLMVLDIGVKERPTGSFSVGAGYSSFDSAIGMFSVAQNNLFGKGQKLSATGSIGARTTEMDIKFTEPWLFDRRISAEFDVYKFERQYYEYTKDSLGGALRLGFPVGFDEDFTRGLVGYAYEDADISDVFENASILIQEMVGRNVTSSMTFGLRRNSKDRPWNTREGSYNSITYEYAGGPLGGDVGFDRYQVTSGWYFPLPKDTSFMAQGRWGYVVKRGDEKLPVYQKFRLGGINTIRGFDDYSISPRDPDTGDRIGGEKMMIFNFEYRFPLIKDQGITGIVFFDAGNSWTKDDSYSFSDVKKSVGTGIRWYSPIGPLRIEYGWVIGPVEDEESGAWAFSVGGIF